MKPPSQIGVGERVPAPAIKRLPSSIVPQQSRHLDLSNCVRPDLGSTLVAREVTQVTVFPAATIDRYIRSVAAHGEIRLYFASSELSAAWAALAWAEVSGRRAAVLVSAAFSVPHLAHVVARAVEFHLPVDFLFLGPDITGFLPPGWWPPTVSLDELERCRPSLREGPLAVVEHLPTGWAAITSEPSKARLSAPVVSRGWVVDRRAAGFDVVIALPPALQPWRSIFERMAVEWRLPAVTMGGFDPFCRRHPELWLGRVGFVPSPRAFELLSRQGTGLIIVPTGTAVPSWIKAQVVSCGGEELAGMGLAAPAPGTERFGHDRGDLGLLTARVWPGPDANSVSPGLAAITTLAVRYPSALFVADAGSPHRYVAGAVANAGRPVLLTDGLTFMGWSLPTTLGAALADPERSLVTVIGDGSVFMAGSELAALVHHRVPAVVVLLANGTLGERYARSPRLRERAQLPSVDWPAFGHSLGVESARWRPGDDEVLLRADAALAERRPFLLEVETPSLHPDQKWFPIVVDGVDELLSAEEQES